MPRTTREKLIRYHEQALNNMDRALKDLKNMRDIYEDGYTNQATMIDQIGRAIMEVKGLLQRFRDEMM